MNKLYVALGSAAFCLALYGAYALQISGLRSQVTTANSQRDRAVEAARALSRANDAFTETIDKQNKQIDALKLAADARGKVVAAAQAAAKIEGQHQQAAAIALLKRPPAKPNDACDSLDTLLTETIRGRK